MLEITEENPSPRTFNVEGEKILTSYETVVQSLVGQIVPERKEDVVKQFEDRKKDRKKTEKPQTYIRRFAELKKQSDFDEICL